MTPMATILTIGAGVVLVLLLLRALQAVRMETGNTRGIEPGTGHTTVEVTYTSGGGGGGDVARFHVPKDPQEYARAFVPKQKDDADV